MDGIARLGFSFPVTLDTTITLLHHRIPIVVAGPVN